MSNREMLNRHQFIIEKATLNDLAVIGEIENKSHVSPWTESMLSESLNCEHWCWKISIENQIVGYLIVMALVDELEILNIAVAPAEQGQGFAKALLKHLFHFAEKGEYKTLFLEVRASNQAAIRLYQNFGFIQVGCRKNYYSGTQSREDALIMRRIL